jgi:hypothetical protein
MKRILRFIKALWTHIKNGSPKSSKELILQRLAICKSCEYYDAQLERCDHCGCNINDKEILMNKLAWRDQECPLPTPKWTKVK